MFRAILGPRTLPVAITTKLAYQMVCVKLAIYLVYYNMLEEPVQILIGKAAPVQISVQTV